MESLNKQTRQSKLIFDCRQLMGRVILNAVDNIETKADFEFWSRANTHNIEYFRANLSDYIRIPKLMPGEVSHDCRQLMADQIRTLITSSMQNVNREQDSLKPGPHVVTVE